MTRLQETERAYLDAKLEYLSVLLQDIANRQASQDAITAHNNTYSQFCACEKRLMTLDEEIAR